MLQRELRQIPLTAFLAVAGILLPQIFHLFGLGAIFLPMFLPVMLGGLILTWRFALLLAVITPLISWLFTGMPPLVPPVLPVLIVELLVVNAILSLLHVHLKWNLWAALLLAILTDRLLLLTLVSVIAPLFGWRHPLFSLALVSSGLPGIALQMVVLPLTVRLIRERWKLRLE
ncbi:hypothetical protein ACX8XP_01135 [Calditrichota bacterium LG25]